MNVACTHITSVVHLIVYVGPEWEDAVVAFDHKDDADEHCANLERARTDGVLQRSLAKHRPHPELSCYMVKTLVLHTRKS